MNGWMDWMVVARQGPGALNEGDSSSAGQNLLQRWRDPGLFEHSRLLPNGDCRRSSPFRDWVAPALAAGAWLGWGLPDDCSLVSGRVPRLVIPDRLVWCPRGLLPGTRVAIVSSRLGRRLDLIPEWFAAFREAVAQRDWQSEFLLAGAKTTTERFLRRAAERWQARLLTVHAPHSKTSGEQWLQRVVRNAFPAGSGPEFHAYLSPAMVPSSDRSAGGLDCRALVDRAIVDWCDELVVLRLRRGGNLEPLVRQRLTDRPDFDSRVTVAAGQQLVSPSLADQLQNLGAVPWIPLRQGLAHHSDKASELSLEEEAKPPPTGSAANLVHSVCQPIMTNELAGEVVSFSAVEYLGSVGSGSDAPWRYLTHCTRAPSGPWPGQSAEDFLDELLWDGDPQSRSPLASLLRIVTEGRICAASRMLRGGVPAVCFTAVPWREIGQLRDYQPHRMCWTFEPYGICVSSDWLVSRGARPVIYGDDGDWDRLPAEDRPFFQLRETRRGRRRRDWTREREWRHLGDVDLTSLPAEDAVVFVRTAEEAAEVARHCRWPVTTRDQRAAAASHSAS